MSDRLILESIEKVKAKTIAVEAEIKRLDLEIARKNEIIAQKDAALEMMHKHSKLKFHDYLMLYQSYAPEIKKVFPEVVTTDAIATKRATTGRTSIMGKFYPLRLRRWEEFTRLNSESLSRLKTKFATRLLFPSRDDTKTICDVLLKSYMTSLAHHFYTSEVKTSSFLYATIHFPVKHILNAFLEDGSETRCTLTQSSYRSIPPSDAYDESTTASPDDISDTLPHITYLNCALFSFSRPTFDEPDAIKAPIDKSSIDDNSEAKSTTKQPAWVTSCHMIGEHKPAHRLRSHVVEKILPRLAEEEDFVLQLACERNNATLNLDHANISNSRSRMQNQVYFASALTQLFHSMVSSGFEYGMLESGETVTFAKIAADDPTTLFYHTLLFPANSDPNSINADHTAVAQVSAFCLMALDSQQWSSKQISEAKKKLFTFPNHPLSLVSGVVAESGGQPNPQRQPWESHGENANTQPKPPPILTQRELYPPGSDWNNSSHNYYVIPAPLNPPDLTPVSHFDPVSSKPILLYCTQACLLGLVRGGYLDQLCPNFILHRNAHSNVVQPNPAKGNHPISSAQLARLLQMQIGSNCERDCQYLGEDSEYGALGDMFKLTLSGYGYTFCAKGVQPGYRQAIQRESQVYAHLADKQGISIPVHLSVIELADSYPTLHCTEIKYMILMSYGGETILHSRVRRRVKRLFPEVDLDDEAERTWNELFDAGVDGSDAENENELVWCEETRRVMKIDFDRSQVFKRNTDKDTATHAVPQMSTKKRNRSLSMNKDLGDDMLHEAKKPCLEQYQKVKVEALLLS